MLWRVALQTGLPALMIRKRGGDETCPASGIDMFITSISMRSLLTLDARSIVTYYMSAKDWRARTLPLVAVSRLSCCSLAVICAGPIAFPATAAAAAVSTTDAACPMSLLLCTCVNRPYACRSHTCFNRIDLPMYSNKKELEEYLTMAINMECTGFGIE